jgi:hypothetical protein
MQQSYATLAVELMVRLQRTPDGDYTTTMTLADGVQATGWLKLSPDEDWSLEPPSHYRSTQKAITRSSQVATRDRAVDIGRRLFKLLFSGSLRSLYERMALSSPAIRLRIASDDLIALGLPWELLYDDDVRRDFMSLATESSVLRMREPHLGPILAPVPAPLRVLVVTADEHGGLEVERDVELLTTLTDAPSYVQVETLENATVPMLKDRLRDGPSFHVLHFAGTGTIDGDGTRTRQMLALEPAAGASQTPATLAPERLTEWLGPTETDLRFVYLNACNTDEFAAIVSGTVPAVLGMRGEASVDGCTTFARTFYRALLDGAPIDVASWYARREHETVLPGRREWANMTLYVAGSGPLVHELDVVGAATGTAPMTSAGDGADTRDVDLLRRKKSIVERNLRSIDTQLETLGDAAPEAIHSEKVRLTTELEAVSSELGGAG